MLVESPSFSCNDFTADREGNLSGRATPGSQAVVRASPRGPSGTAGPWALLTSPGLWRDERIWGSLCWAGKSLGLPKRLCVQRWRQEEIDPGGEEQQPWWIYGSGKEREAFLWERWMQIALRICVACALWWHPICPQGLYFVASWLTPASSPALFIQVQFLDEPIGCSTAIPVWSSSLLQVRAVSALQSNILVLHQSGKKIQPCPVSKEGRSSLELCYHPNGWHSWQCFIRGVSFLAETCLLQFRGLAVVILEVLVVNESHQVSGGDVATACT